MAIRSSKPSRKLSGHASHTQDSAAQGLPGVVLRPIKLTMLGAGSGFTPRLLNDVLHIPGNQGGVIALVDIDLSRLRTMHKLIVKLVAKLGQEKKWKVVASPDRTQVLSGTDYIVNCIEVS
ncbi:MAG: alpha-glucosidase/alpha-galactosidase, partial [Burkholderiales bacterium]|nr:alpha-glucosidase/alpha-galactosidase [Opitutaceae bacterium]